MKNFRLMLLGSVVAGVGAMAATDASAADVTKSVKVSGHVNRVIAVVDDGSNSEINNVDSHASRSRFRIVGEAKGPDVSVKAILEFGAHSNLASGQDQEDNNTNGGENAGGATGENNVNLRKSQIIISTKYGQLDVGQGYTAVDGAGGTNMSGTALSTGYGSGDHNASGTFFVIKNQEAGTAVSNTASYGATTYTVGGSYWNPGDPSRHDNITYWTPEIMGFTAGVSHAQGGGFDAGLFYGAEFAGFDVEFGAGYSNYESAGSGSGGSTEDWVVSGGFLHKATGINLSLSYGVESLNAQTLTTTASNRWNESASLGWRTKNLTSLGETRFSVDYRRSLHAAAQGSAYERIGGAIVQTIPDYGTEVYVGVDNHELTLKSRDGLSAAAMDFDDVTAGWIGARVKF